MENLMGEYAVVPRGLEEFAQRLQFAIVLASPDTLILSHQHWLVPRRKQYIEYLIAHEERVKECMKLSPSLFLI